nr:NADH dehydrogenase subunit 5 [Hoplopleura pacifica]
MRSVKVHLFTLSVMTLFLVFLVFSWLIGKGSYQTWTWSCLHMRGGFIDVEWVVDFHGVCFASTVCLVSSMVLMYSMFYMPGEMKNIFLVILSSFIVSMLFLTMSKSMFWAIVGWDGLGVTSFLLILHFKSFASVKSSMVTFITNRIGDVFMLTSIGLSVLYCSDFCNYFFLGSFVMLGAMTKSAQFPFSAWLPLAMAAPTPVSSLVHSSTLVTAGVFLLTRFNYLITGLESALVLVGFITIIYSGLSAMFEWDLKKIIAFSTLSHLSLMVMMISLNSLVASTFHMMMHALFKSVLFMSAGSIIYLNSDTQDIRAIRISLSSHSFQILFMVTFIAMMGLPALSGFYSKELMAAVCQPVEGSLVHLVGFILGVFLTSGYSSRVVLSMVVHHCGTPLFSSPSGVSLLLKPVVLMTPLVVSSGTWTCLFMASSCSSGASMDSLILMSSAIVSALSLGMLAGWALAYPCQLNLSFWLFGKWSVYFILSSVKSVVKLTKMLMSVDTEGLNMFSVYLLGGSVPKILTLLEYNLVNQSFIPMKLFILMVTGLTIYLW